MIGSIRYPIGNDIFQMSQLVICAVVQLVHQNMLSLQLIVNQIQAESSLLTGESQKLLYVRVKVDGRKSGQYQKWTISKVDSTKSGRFQSERFQKWTVPKVDGRFNK